MFSSFASIAKLLYRGGRRAPALNRDKRARLNVEVLERRDCPTGLSLTLDAVVLPDHHVQLTGQVSGDNASNAFVNFSGAVSDTTVANGSGYFTLTTNTAQLGTVYAVASDSEMNESDPVNDTLATPAPQLTLSITSFTQTTVTLSGTVTSIDAGGALSVNISGLASASPVTDGNGDFSATVEVSVGGTFYASVMDTWAQSGDAQTDFVNNPGDPPDVSVVLDNLMPKTNDLLTAQVTLTGGPQGPYIYQWVWTVNGQTVQTDENANVTDTLDLSVPGNGDKNDDVEVTVTPIGSGASGFAGAFVANSPPVFDPITFTSPAIADDDVPDGSSFFTNGMVLGQLHATDPDGDPLTYTTPASPSLNDPANFLTVTPDGKVMVANAQGLNAYFDPPGTNGTQIVLPVGVTDGTLEDSSNFTLGVLTDWIPQNAIYIETNTGVIYEPDTSGEMLDNLRAIQAAGQTVSLLIIKGHGGGAGILVGSDQTNMSTVEVANGQQQVFLGGNVTALLQSVTDNNSTIRFRGCFTAQLAARVQQALGNGARCTGAVRFAIGIPGTAWIIAVTR